MRTLKACCWIFGCLGSVCATIDLLDVTVYSRFANLPQSQVVASDRVIGAVLLACLLTFLAGVAIPEAPPSVEDLVAELLEDPHCAMCNNTGRMDCYDCQGHGAVGWGNVHACPTCRGAGRLQCTGFKHTRATHSALPF